MEPSIKTVLTLATGLSREGFAMWLRSHGFKERPISTKRVFVGEFCVVKFDCTVDAFDKPTLYEYRNRRRVAAWKRRWLAKTLGWANGVLVQEKIIPCLHQGHATQGLCCKEAELLARRLRIMDWYNHGSRTNGQLVFFDFDSFGSGWWNWRRKKGQKHEKN